MSETIHPVFVIASPRSGTTMLGSMLGGHSEAIALPESPFISTIFYECFTNDVDSISLDTVSQSIEENFRFSHWGFGSNFNVSEFANEHELTRKGYQNLISRLVLHYAQEQSKNNIRLWVEHSPVNSRYVLMLNQLFPDAKFIHLIRDGRAIAASVLPLDWGADSAQEAAHNWQGDLSYCLNAELMLGSDRCMRVYYEEIVASPKQELEKLCEFIGLNFQDVMIEGTGLKIPNYTKNQHKLIGEKPDKFRLTAWQNKLSQRNIKLFEDIAGTMLANLGYSLYCSRKKEFPKTVERMKLVLLSFVRKEIVNRLRIKMRSSL